jgi:uncharacterized protein YndB with AHSA1/START domain
MSTPVHQSRSSPADGIIETRDGFHILRFKRHFHHSIERVWAAITEPGQLVAWLAEADVDLRKGGRIQLRWLNTGTVLNGTITQLDPPRLLEYAGDIHGLLRWELQEVPGGCVLTFSSTIPAPDFRIALFLAGWHVHLDFLEEALDGHVVDWPHWPKDRWDRHYERYSQKQSEKPEERS